MITPGTNVKTRRSLSGLTRGQLVFLISTRIRLMEVLITYELDGAHGTTSAVHEDYETARDEAKNLLPENALMLNIRVH